MSVAAADLFSRLQDARFYRKLHVDAMALARARPGGLWLDLGCGPGLWASLAADAGYNALGVDRDADMIAAARRRHGDSAARYEVGDIARMLSAGERYDVVSASSLAAVTGEPARTIAQLRELAAPGGIVLLIEAAPAMSRTKALAQILFGHLGRGAGMLAAWAAARSGSALPDRIFYDPAWTTIKRPLLGGMVNAWALASA